IVSRHDQRGAPIRVGFIPRLKEVWGLKCRGPGASGVQPSPLVNECGLADQASSIRVLEHSDPHQIVLLADISWSYTDSTRAMRYANDKSGSTRRRAAKARVAVPSESSSTRLSAALNFSGVFLGTSRPCTPSVTSSPVPPTLVATSGVSMAMASRTQLGVPS